MKYSINLQNAYEIFKNSVSILKGFVSTMRRLFCEPKKYFVVQTEQGEIRGKESISALTKIKYCSFLSIPYAKPPVGELRFRPPQASEAWNNIYDATYERSPCYQSILFVPVTFGSEDCLYLNVYTSKPPDEITTLLPVMLYIHGGGFMVGSGRKWMYSPDFLINHDIILITINYRLQALGFLNVGIEECPGNVGMKDQVCAMQWVQKNIKNFGGNPDNVTIFGQSAGSSAVHYHMMSPLSQGLFHKAILQSGSSLSPWAFTRNPTEVAFAIGREAGYYGNNRIELVSFLRNISAYKLSIALQKMLKKRDQTGGLYLSYISPSVEIIADGAFLPDIPEKLLKLIKPIPIIYGKNSREGMMAYSGIFRSVVPKLRKGFISCVQNYFAINSEILPEVAEQIYQVYFENAPISSQAGNEITDFFDDIWFYRFYEAVGPLIKSKAPVHLYLFTYEGGLSFFTRFVRFINPFVNLNKKGACHADEACYLFNQVFFKKYSKIQDEDRKMIRFMTKMWTNFAATGNPSMDDIQWEPTTTNESQYLDINSNPKIKKGKIGGEKFEKLHKILHPIAELI